MWQLLWSDAALTAHSLHGWVSHFCSFLFFFCFFFLLVLFLLILNSQNIALVRCYILQQLGELILFFSSRPTQAQIEVIRVVYNRISTAAHLFKDLASSALYLHSRHSIRSLQPLPFNSTGLSSVENAVLSLLAMSSQSCGLLGRQEITSRASATSCLTSSQRNCGILQVNTC